MTYQLGVDLGTTYTAAAIHRDGRTDIFELGNRSSTIPSVIFLGEDGTILTGEAWEDVARKGFDDSRLFAAYLNTLKWNCVTSTDPRLFQSPFRAGIRLDAYQLEPLRKALRMPRVNLFIADDVGQRLHLLYLGVGGIELIGQVRMIGACMLGSNAILHQP